MLTGLKVSILYILSFVNIIFNILFLDLERRLQEKVIECSSLRSTVNQLTAELKNVKQQLLDERLYRFGINMPQQTSQPVCTTSRIFTSTPTPNVIHFNQQNSNAENKIEFDKIQLRKTNNLDILCQNSTTDSISSESLQKSDDSLSRLLLSDENPTNYFNGSNEECFNFDWDLTACDADMSDIGDLDQSTEVNCVPSSVYQKQQQKKTLGGPPNNIYPPPEKIGNLHVPAFTTKVNLADISLRHNGTLGANW